MLSALLTTSMFFTMPTADVLAAQWKDVVQFSVHMISGFVPLPEDLEQQTIVENIETDMENLVKLPNRLAAYETTLPVMQENTDKEEQDTSVSLVLSSDVVQGVHQNPITIESVTWQRTHLK